MRRWRQKAVQEASELLAGEVMLEIESSYVQVVPLVSWAH